MELKGGPPPPPGQQTKMSGTISPRDRLQLWVNTFLLKQKENSGSVTATFRDMNGEKSWLNGWLVISVPMSPWDSLPSCSTCM